MDNKAREREISLEFVVDKKDEVQEVYANFISVSHTSWDFTMLFCCATMPLEHEVEEPVGEKLQVKAPCVARVKIPANSIDGLIVALQKQRDKYRENMEQNIKEGNRA